MNHRPATLTASLACAVMLVLTGCSSSGGGNANVDVTTVPLQPGDLPSSWTAKAHDSSGDGDSKASSKMIAACVGAKDTSGDRVKRVDSKDYSSGNSSINSHATEYKSSSDVDADAKAYSNPKIKSCLETAFKQQAAKGLQSGTTLGKVDFTIKPGSNGGPSNVVATVTADVPVTVSGQTLTVHATTVAIRGNKIEASLEFTGVGKPIDQSTITKAIAAVAKRAQG